MSLKEVSKIFQEYSKPDLIGKEGILNIFSLLGIDFEKKENMKKYKNILKGNKRINKDLYLHLFEIMTNYISDYVSFPVLNPLLF